MHVFWVLGPLHSALNAQTKAVWVADWLKREAENNRVSDYLFKIDLLVKNDKVIRFG